MLKMLKNQKGQGMVEYTLLIGTIAVAVVAILVLFSPELQRILNAILAALQGVQTPAA